MLLVGGGDIALRKASLLARAGARLRVVAPDILPELARLADAGGGCVWRRGYAAADLSGALFAVSATDDDALNRRVRADATAAGVLVNVVDSPALCDFIFPALVDRSPLVVAVSSGGSAPVLARNVRAKIETSLPSALAQLSALCGRFRESVKAALPAARRRRFWEETLDGPAAEAALAGDASGAETLFADALRRFAADKPAQTGEVYLIGAGPGDADLLTFRAHRLLQKADVVVYDKLVSAEVLELARRDATKIFVGKRRDSHTMAQEEINQLLIDHARRGLCVARLKGGDPFVFGRGGEEMLALRAAGVPYQIAAGITAALGCAAAAGIPLTHRGLARGARLCTAYRQDMHDAAYWRSLAADENTLVFYMAGETLAEVADNLVGAGRAATTPVLVICAGTTRRQKIFSGVLGNIAKHEREVFSPTLIIVGEVAGLRVQMADESDAPLSLSAGDAPAQQKHAAA